MPSNPSQHPPIPVICDRCRAEGAAGDSAFIAIRDLLVFDPVPRRAHVNNWTAEHQRAFIAALAMTGSPRQAARALGRHMFGAQQLRTAKGGRSFAEAWDSALELYRERELARIQENLAGLARQQAERDTGGLAESHLRALPPSSSPSAAAARGPEPEAPPFGRHVEAIYGEEYNPDDYLEGHADYVERMGAVRDRLLAARRLYLASIAPDPECRAAWEVLVGPVDWERARHMQPQADEPPYQAGGTPIVPSLAAPDMLIAANNGALPELTGGADQIGEALAIIRSARAADAEGEGEGSSGEGGGGDWSEDDWSDGSLGGGGWDGGWGERDRDDPTSAWEDGR